MSILLKSTVPTNVTMAIKDIDEIMGITYFYLTGFMSLLSMVGAVVIVGVYIWYPWIRTSGRKMLLWLSVADFLTATGNLMGIFWYINKSNMADDVCIGICKTHAALTIFSSISSFFWTVAIGIHLYICIVIANAQMAKKITVPCHLLCWILPGIVAIVALGLDVLGYDPDLGFPSWCWIEPSVHRALFWQYMSGKFWEMLAYVIVCVLYAIIKYKLEAQVKRRQKLSNGVNTGVINDASKKLTFVPVAFIAVRIWGTLRFIMDAHFSYNAAWIVPLQGVGDSAQGFANCILFCTMTDKLNKKIKRGLCGCTQKNRIEVMTGTSVEGSNS